MKKQVYSIRLDPELRDKAEKQAASENRTLSNWIEKLIQDRLRQKAKN